MLDGASKEELMEFGKAFGEGLKQGMPVAAEKEPNSFLMLCVVVTMALAAIVLCIVVLKYMIDARRAERDERVRREEREAKREGERDSIDSARAAACHASHKEVVDKATDAIVRSTAAVESSNRLGERCLTAIENNGRVFERCVDVLAQIKNGGSAQ